MYSVWTRAKDDDNIIGYIEVVSVSTSYSRYCFLSLSSLFYNLWTCVLWTFISCLVGIYSVDTILYFYTLPIDYFPTLISSLCLKLQPELSLKVMTVFKL